MDGKISYRILDTHTPRYVMFSARFKRLTEELIKSALLTNID